MCVPCSKTCACFSADAEHLSETQLHFPDYVFLFFYSSSSSSSLFPLSVVQLIVSPLFEDAHWITNLLLARRITCRRTNVALSHRKFCERRSVTTRALFPIEKVSVPQKREQGFFASAIFWFHNTFAYSLYLQHTRKIRSGKFLFLWGTLCTCIINHVFYIMFLNFFVIQFLLELRPVSLFLLHIYVSPCRYIILLKVNV